MVGVKKNLVTFIDVLMSKWHNNMDMFGTVKKRNSVEF